MLRLARTAALVFPKDQPIQAASRNWALDLSEDCVAVFAIGQLKNDSWRCAAVSATAAANACGSPKSATAPVAIGISERTGGIAGLTAMVAVMTGIFGAVAGPGLLAAAGIRDERAAGFALGLVSHAIGTARAFQVSETAGAFASVGMILNAVLTVLLAPLLLALLMP